MCNKINITHVPGRKSSCSFTIRHIWHVHVHISDPQTCLTGRSLTCCMSVKGATYSRVMATAVPPNTENGGETGEERNGMHSWWICHFGLWPGSHPIAFKLAAACKTLHISHGVPHALLGPSAPTTTLINQPLREKKRRTGAPLSSYPSHSHSLWSLQTPRCMLTVPHTINMQQG